MISPGHVFPLRARDGGVLERGGHTEGSVDLALLAGFQSAWAEATLPAALDTRPGEPYVDAVLKATPALKINVLAVEKMIAGGKPIAFTKSTSQKLKNMAQGPKDWM